MNTPTNDSMPPASGDGDLSAAPGFSAAELHALRNRVSDLERQRNRYKKRYEAATEDRNETQAQTLIRYAKQEPHEVFRDEKGEAYITFGMDGIMRSAPIRGSAFGHWLRWCFYDEHEKPPGAQAVQDAREHLCAHAEFEGAKHTVELRNAETADGIEIDLGGDDWRCVRVTSEKWEVTVRPRAKFRRSKATASYAFPVRGEKGLSLLRQHIRVKDDENFALLCGWLVQALRPSGPYPVLVLTGEQGSGKTTTAELIRQIVDPSMLPTRSAPRNEEDLAVAADNSHVLNFDNLSGVSPWLSDALCRLATGGGFATRQLYTNREESIFHGARPVILNGIEDLTARPDLADRAVILELAPIPDEERRTAEEIRDAFNNDRAEIFGALLDALSTAMDRVKSINLDSLPRMADFAKWAQAAEICYGVEPGTFARAYEENRDVANETALEADEVATAVVHMLEDKGSWTGKMSDLPKVLKAYLFDSETPPKELQSWQALSGWFKRKMPVLRRAGVQREDDPRERIRAFTLSLVEDADGEAPF